MSYPVSILADILTPDKFSVVSTIAEDVEKIEEVEEQMRLEIQYEDTPEGPLSANMHVAVKDLTGQLRRGLIQKKVNEDLFEVLLIDYGRAIKTSKANLRLITNKSFLEPEALSYTVRLYGIIPTISTYLQGIKKPRACVEWSLESFKFVKSNLKIDQHVVIQRVLVHNKIVYGDLFFKPKPDMKFTSLRVSLCKQDFCTYSESNFLRLKGWSVPSENEYDGKSEIERKINLFRPDQKRTNAASSSFSASACSTKISFNSSPPKSLGLGRGKLKQLIAEMKKDKNLDRGQRSPGDLLKEIDVEEEIETKGSQIPPKFEKKKPQKHFEISDSSDVSKVGPFKKVDPPVVLPCTKEKEESKQSSKQYFNQGSKQNFNQGSKQNFNQGSKPNSYQSSRENFYQNFCEKLWESAKETIPAKKPPIKRPVSIDSESTSGRSNYRASHFFKVNIKVWNQPLNFMKFNRFCGPYVEFDDTIVEPLNTFKDLPIQLSIIQNLEKEGAFRDLSQVQRWAIPTILRQLNAVIIGSSKCGKTLSYILAIINYVQDSTYFEELPPGNGPYVVIVASSSRVCESIYYMCHLLLGNFTKTKMKNSVIQVALAHGNGCEKEIWVELTNGCHILISTPHCLVRLLKYPILTNLERLTCLVLDEIDIISENPFRKNVRVILEKASFATKNRFYQCILVGEKWTPNVENLVKTYMKSRAYIIASSAEAVIFKKLKPSIYLVDREQKFEAFLNLLEEKIKKLKTIVVCEERTEACRLHDLLAERGISSYLAHDRVMADQLREIHVYWKISLESVLIATDEVLNELNIKEAEALIHFELPKKSKTNFYLRYSTLKGFLWDGRRFLKKKGKDLNVESIIIVDDENHRQLPHVIDFVTRLGGKIPPKILRKCEEILWRIEIEKSDTPVCQNLLAIGRCRNSKDCRKRHALVKDLDSPTDLPTSGWVNFVFLKMQHASCFYVELFEHVDSKGNITKIGNLRSEMIKKVAKYFASVNNQRTVGMAKCGDVCAVMSIDEDKEVFHRAKIIQILKVDKHGKALEVNVKLLDEGNIWMRKSTELFELPIDLSSHPPTATDVWVVGIQPKDFDVSWSATANEFVSDLMSEKLRSNQYWSGKIVLALNNTLFLDPIKRKEFLPVLRSHVFDLILQGELRNKGIAVTNNEHLPVLLELCTTGGIDVPNKEERKKDLSVHAQSAFFDSDLIRVTFLAAENTSLVFLQPHKFKKLLQDLEEDCQKEAAEVTNAKNSKLVEIIPGMFCLALCQDGRWNRGRIESENETEFNVFFIDHGDIMFVSKTDVIPISQNLLLKLPAQAIECSLVGIHSEEKCSDEVLKEIYSFAEDGEEALYAYIIDKDLQPSFTRGRKYKLNLLNSKGISLNKILVDKGMALVEESEGKYLEDIEMGDSDDGDEEMKREVGEEEEEENFKKGKNSWVDHFNNFNFENEETLEFLKEFASKILPTPVKADILKEDSRVQKPQIAYKTEEETPENQQKTEKIKGDSQEDSRPETQTNTQETMIDQLKLKTRKNVLTPPVLWCQNQLEVQIKIKLGNVEDYSLECTFHNFSFRSLVKGKLYAVDLKLFGAINPQKTKITIKTFYVAVVLTKLSFPLWPRLHADEEKHNWINLDVENLADKNDAFADRIQSAKIAIESGLMKKEVRSANLKSYSDSEEEEIDIEDEENQELD